MGTKYSVFMSHASEDKIEYVDDLVKEIEKLGITVFYDKDAIDWGDNLKAAIDDALKNCSLAVIVISPSYFGRKWTEYEIGALLRRQDSENNKVILPILYRVSKEEFTNHYPMLKDVVFKYAKSRSKEQLALDVQKELNKKVSQENDSL